MTTKTRNKSARDIQDDIFRKMPAGKKIRLASNFFALARKLNKDWARTLVQKDGIHPPTGRYRINSCDSEKTRLEISEKMGSDAWHF